MLNVSTRHLVDGSSNGPLLYCTYNDSIRVLERLTPNDFQYPISRVASCKVGRGVFELDDISSIKAQLSSFENKIKNLDCASEVLTIQLAQQMVALVFTCEIYGENHSYENCPQHAKNASYVSRI
ncbi:hypothetical protein V6N13_113714 [Hibiscus sabdariffa]|uniref:Uncharacterized protein n=1 Tax=Hibiscus sabdariffa TaxID=183260 RepID=A0ABR2TZZ0_9ROSI